MIVRFLKLVIALSAASQLQGCRWALNGTPSGSAWYAISLDSEIKDIGSSGLAIIQNVSSTTLKFNVCERVLERREGGRWVVVDTLSAGPNCERGPHDLPGKVAVDTYVSLPKTAAPGAYRIVFPGLLGPAGRTLPADDHASNPFAIRSNR
jgi:hypothetical protein